MLVNNGKISKITVNVLPKFVTIEILIYFHVKNWTENNDVE